MEKAFFKNIRQEIIPYLQNARDEVVIAMAWFTSGELFQELIDCLRRKVRVELVLLDNATNFMYYAPDFNELIKAGGVFRIAKVEDGFMHHKFCVVDNNVVITGSYNWTYFAETRNIENIVISNNNDVVSQYRKEFTELSVKTDIATACPRLDWSEIGSCEHINFDELNYEIDEIAKYQGLPQRTVAKSSTTVTFEERPLNPVARYAIGIKATTKGNNCSMRTIIPSGATLPYTSQYTEFYNYSDHRNNVILTVLYDDNQVKKLITEESITKITAGRSDWELTIRIQFMLTQNGKLYAEIRCMETGVVMNVEASNRDFVDYE